MTAAKYNLTIYQGATFSTPMRLRDQTSGLPIDLTGAVVRSAARINYSDSTPLFTFTCTLSGTPTDGRFTVSLTATQTAALDFEKAFYDLEVEFPGGTVVRYLNGNVIFKREATQ